jgi:hypothetical protein
MKVKITVVRLNQTDEHIVEVSQQRVNTIRNQINQGFLFSIYDGVAFIGTYKSNDFESLEVI